jgi:hypothetical protein
VPQEVRSIIRSIENKIKDLDVKDAYNIGIVAIKEFDAAREYKNSITILVKFLKYPNIEVFSVNKVKIISHLILRALLIGELEEYNEIINNEKNLKKSILGNISQLLVNSSNETDGEFILDGIEKVDLFGDLNPLEQIPQLKFDDEDEIVRIIEDYYENAVYHLTYFEKVSKLHHTITINSGKLEELNVVEKKRILKL